MKNENVDFEKMIEEYKNSIDENLVDFALKVRDRLFKYPNNRNYSIGEVSERTAVDINRLIGVNIVGYEHNLKGSVVEHIEIRHGVDGEQDHSMADINDYGRVGYVLENYDTVELLYDCTGNVKYSTGFLNSQQKPSPLIRYEKRINGIFYVVEAVTDSKSRQLQIVSIYKKKAKIKDRQVLDGSQTPEHHVQNDLAAIPVSSAKTRGGQMPDVVQTPRLNVRNAYAATPTDKLTHLQEKVNTQNLNPPQNNKKESL